MYFSLTDTEYEYSVCPLYSVLYFALCTERVTVQSTLDKKTSHERRVVWASVDPHGNSLLRRSALSYLSSPYFVVVVYYSVCMYVYVDPIILRALYVL